MNNSNNSNNWQKPVPYSNDLLSLLNNIKKNIKEVSIDQVDDLISNQSDNNFYLIDIRDKEEFDQVRIDKSIHISRGFLEFKINSVVPDQKANVILYCGSGGRSAFAAESLERMGYSNVSSMAGGIKAWYESGKPVK